MALVATVLVLLSGIVVSVAALAMTSHVEPNSPHMVQRSPGAGVIASSPATPPTGSLSTADTDDALDHADDEASADLDD